MSNDQFDDTAKTKPERNIRRFIANGFIASEYRPKNWPFFDGKRLKRQFLNTLEEAICNFDDYEPGLERPLPAIEPRTTVFVGDKEKFVDWKLQWITQNDGHICLHLDFGGDGFLAGTLDRDAFMDEEGLTDCLKAIKDASSFLPEGGA
jgi:hypothetical protein